MKAGASVHQCRSTCTNSDAIESKADDCDNQNDLAGIKRIDSRSLRQPSQCRVLAFESFHEPGIAVGLTELRSAGHFIPVGEFGAACGIGVRPEAMHPSVRGPRE
jgi:hypothetical protein